MLSVSVTTTRCQYQWGVGLQVNKFEQVSSDDHQMSLAGGNGLEGWWVCPGVGVGYPLPCDLSHDVCDVIFPVSGQTHAYENITFSQLMRVVKTTTEITENVG